MTKETIAAFKEEIIGAFAFEFSEDAGLPEWIQLIPIGQWDHDLYGRISIAASDILEFKRNFEAKIRKGVFITAGHEGSEELPAQGWVLAVDNRPDGLWGKVDWTQLGKQTLSDKQFKFFSPEFYLEYEDPETHQVYRNVLTGGALTKSPYFKELQAVVFSDKHINQPQPNTMNTADILKKKASERSDAEKAFLTANKAKMSEPEIAQVTAEEAAAKVEADAAAAKKAEEDAAAAKKAEEDANEAKGLNRDGSVKASEKTGMQQISAAELSILTEKANKGAEALKKLEASELTTAVGALVFNDKTKTGTFLPKDEEALKTFMEGLKSEQRTAFSALIAAIPAKEIFREVGDGSAPAAGSVQKEIDAKVAGIQASDKTISYSTALKRVFSEDKNLENRYDAELRGK